MSKEVFEVKQQFTARLTPEESEFVNQNLIDLLPDDVETADVTNRSFFMNLVNKTLTKVSAIKDKSKPADIETIEKLKKELEDYKSLQIENNVNAERLQQKIEELESKNTNLIESNNEAAETIELQNETIEDLNEKLSETGEKAETLQKSLTKENRVILDLSPAQLAVTEQFRQRLEKREKKEISIGQMLFVHFWTYIKEQKTQVTFPFLLSQREIKNILLEHKKQQS